MCSFTHHFSCTQACQNNRAPRRALPACPVCACTWFYTTVCRQVSRVAAICGEERCRHTRREAMKSYESYVVSVGVCDPPPGTTLAIGCVFVVVCLCGCHVPFRFFWSWFWLSNWFAEKRIELCPAVFNHVGFAHRLQSAPRPDACIVRQALRQHASTLRQHVSVVSMLPDGSDPFCLRRRAATLF